MMRIFSPLLPVILLALAFPGTAVAQEASDATGDPAPPPVEEAPEVEADATAGVFDQHIKPSPLVERLLEDPLTTDAERQRLRIFHGRWEDLPALETLTVNERAQLALLRYDLNAPALEDDRVNPLLRAEAALRRGEPEVVLELLQIQPGAQAALLRAQAHEQLGRADAAIAELTPWRDRVLADPHTLDSAAELTAAAQALAILARLEGRSAGEYQLAMDLLARVRETVDPLYWPARLVEAELLIEKDNVPQAAEALVEVLSLNPRAGGAWYLLGRQSARSYQFDKAAAALEELRATNTQHLLADLLEIHTLLRQQNAAAARHALERARQTHPDHRELVALEAAAAALAYNQPRLEAALTHLDQLAPKTPLGYFIVGQYLSQARQYEQGEAVLREAIARQPNDPAPQIELGLLLMQAGRDEPAREALAAAAKLDPFNRRAANQLKLVEELLGYTTIETEHFIIRYRPGIDEVLARDMPAELENIYRDITTVFNHQPARKTYIDIMPDEKWFGVRITGMPDIWTIAASTGDVISLTPPRSGPRQRGIYDWANVVRHEFVHTVTLSLAKNRLPHWFTEAAAVSQETVERSYNTYELLAWAFHHNKLFTLEDITWAFAAPESPADRPLAYAQSHWMLQYITQKHGHDAVLALLARFSEGETDAAAIEAVFGETPEAFMSGFKAWAGEEVRDWGFAAVPADERLRSAVRAGDAVEDAELALMLEKYPNQPELLRVAAARALKGNDAGAARRAVLRYAAARPVDPWADAQLLRLALDAGRTDEAIAALEALDRREPEHGRYAYQLAQIHRSQGDLAAAAHAAQRALQREPYNATFREFTATVALQRGETEQALHHLQALPLLEPDRPVHHLRLAALYKKLNRADDAKAATEKADALNPKEPAEAAAE